MDIVGTNFVSTPSATFTNGNEAGLTVTFGSATGLTLNIPTTLPSGDHVVTVTNPDGQSAKATLTTLGAPFVLTPPTAVTDTNGAVHLIVSGYNFASPGYNGDPAGSIVVVQAVDAQGNASSVDATVAIGPVAPANKPGPQQFIVTLNNTDAGSFTAYDHFNVEVFNADGQHSLLPSAVRAQTARSARPQAAPLPSPASFLVFDQSRTQYHFQLHFDPSIVSDCNAVIASENAQIDAFNAHASPTQLLLGNLTLLQQYPALTVSGQGTGTAATGLVSNASGTLVSNASGTIISQDGNGLVSHDGGSVVSHDGGSVVSHDGGSLVDEYGSSIISQDGNGLVSNASGTLVSDLQVELQSPSLRPVWSLTYRPAQASTAISSSPAWLAMTGAPSTEQACLPRRRMTLPSRPYRSTSRATTKAPPMGPDQWRLLSPPDLPTARLNSCWTSVTRRVSLMSWNTRPPASLSRRLTGRPRRKWSAPRPRWPPLSPNAVPAGSSAVTLSVTGTLFTTGSVVSFNGQALATTVISGNTLTAVVPAALLTAPSTASVTVTNPAPGGGTSNAVSFTVNAATPPTTTATVAGPQNSSGAYTHAALVTLTAAPGSFPVASTSFSVDGGAAQTYTAPFTVSAAGAHTVTFGSVDTKGNVEATKTLRLTVQPIAHVFSAGLQMLSVPADYSGVALGDCLIADQSQTGRLVSCAGQLCPFAHGPRRRPAPRSRLLGAVRRHRPTSMMSARPRRRMRRLPSLCSRAGT